ncbi:LysR substrate-binding domain-containing protein [Vibrio rumoiensis]|uniref:Transcriptional regulator n=1 Tax=Vibrio rumoiensis 1S-45 TaxID=1188252 RepID=A0A1E5DZC6_9VIBR|nr:LysR substrate-binding domain-containing protein [Vibrio rumoiensis]OEF22660.1 transcriptional regulator [Vibrio rumoiensis 1S-45]
MPSRLPSTKELHAFLITAEELSFTAAALRLNVTQGAVSRQIIALEQRLDVTLFHRHARGLTLTVKGGEFLPLVELALNQIQRAVEQVSHDKRTIKLKAPSCITPWLLPKLMQFQQIHPEIDVELTSTIKHMVNFATEHFDAAIGYGDLNKLPATDKNLESDLLFEEKLTPVCSPNLCSDITTFTLDTLSEMTWLHATPEKSDWKLWLRQLSKNTEQPEIANLKAKQNQHFATLDLSVNAAIQGFGIAIGDITLAQTELEMGRLMTPYSLDISSGKGYFLMRPKSSINSSLERLIDELLPNH